MAAFQESPGYALFTANNLWMMLATGLGLFAAAAFGVAPLLPDPADQPQRLVIDTVAPPGIGDRPISKIRPEERTTPAGRFNGRIGHNLNGEDVVWVDYDAAVSMHRVRPNVASERRLERLASETAEDNRISYGCINVPVEFFETHILPVFSNMSAAIYVLPDQLALGEVFSAAP